MSGRHARTPEPPSTSGTFTERVTRRPARVAFVLATGVAIAAPMVAAQPVAAPPTAGEVALDRSVVALRAAAAEAIEREVPPGEGPVNTIGFATVLAATQSSEQADATATFMSASVIAARENFFAGLARQEAEKEAAARDAARREADRQAEAAAAADAAAAPAPAVPSGSAWDALAQCESGGNWGINTGNGYYGGLQFSLSSWRGVGGTGYPHEASRETQIAMGERLKGSGGWGHWPACSRKLGLR